MTKLARNIRKMVKTGIQYQGVVTDLTADGHASVTLSRNGATYKSLPVVGGPVKVGQTVYVDLTTPLPTIVAPGVPEVVQDVKPKLIRRGVPSYSAPEVNNIPIYWNPFPEATGCTLYPYGTFYIIQYEELPPDYAGRTSILKSIDGGETFESVYQFDFGDSYRYLSAPVCSADGKYILFNTDDYDAVNFPSFSGGIWCSKDCGATFDYLSSSIITGRFVTYDNVAVSENGQYMTFAPLTLSSLSKVHYSNDFGETFTMIDTPTGLGSGQDNGGVMINFCVSGDGLVWYCIKEGDDNWGSQAQAGIYKSTDFGATWDKVYSPDSGEYYVGHYASSFGLGVNRDMAASKDGKYVYIISRETHQYSSAPSSTYPDYCYFTSDYGATWSRTVICDGSMNHSSKYPSNPVCSSDGKYVFWSTYTNYPNPYDSWSVFYSDDYFATFQEHSYFGGGGWHGTAGIAMTTNAEIIYVSGGTGYSDVQPGVVRSSNYGSTWSYVDSTHGNFDAFWEGTVVTKDHS